MFDDAYWAARKEAERRLPSVVFVEDGDNGEDWRNKKNPARRLKRYRVEFAGDVIGHVYQERDFAYRKAGRLITRSFHPLRWRHSRGRLFSDTRKEATRDLLIEHVQR